MRRDSRTYGRPSGSPHHARTGDPVGRPTTPVRATHWVAPTPITIMHIEPLTPQNQPAVLAYLRAAPYRNALPLSNATQLRARCDVLVAEQGGAILGAASTYHDLPWPNLTFAAG